MGSLGFHPCVVGTTGNNTYNLGTPWSLSRTVRREVCRSLETELTEQTRAGPGLAPAVTQSPPPSPFNFCPLTSLPDTEGQVSPWFLETNAHCL